MEGRARQHQMLLAFPLAPFTSISCRYFSRLFCLFIDEKRAYAAGKSDEGGYYKTYGSDAEGEKGYLKETYSKGDHGYKTLDTFHKQDGDKYGFEKHFAYGKARLTDESDKHAEQSSKIGKQEDHEGAGTIVDSHYMDNEGDHGGEHTGDYGSHYMAAEPDSESYSDTGDGHSKNYSAGSEGSYESHSSYSSDSDSGGDYGEHY
ncbi:oleosin-B3-like isoform X2 [Vespula pensylvanica]|uniref:oleosin-B3-like isoform X2 n=1 Tax=Vespula pensylvanica TaxID=30213 RepID=UPI001CBA2DE4|nr:oleosin-B3-like isoform X2 [Vespula pensylvanica]XP_050854391.1 uncharacterized protein LOC127065696 isoform X2 [Vespula vulgaris]